MLRKILQWLLKNATFSIYEAHDPVGRYFGTHRLPYDGYIIVHVAVGNEIILLGHFKRV